jgi:uncharacterized protein (TIGR02594 family)
MSICGWFKKRRKESYIKLDPRPDVEKSVKTVENKKFKEPFWLHTAIKEIGQREIPGPKHNVRILEYGKAVNLKVTTDEIPWCANVMNWILMVNLLKRTKSAMARSFLDWGINLDAPRYGCVVVFWRGSPSSSSGHVGFYLGMIGDWVIVLGGNQNNEFTASLYHNSRVLGYRWPEEGVEDDA